MLKPISGFRLVSLLVLVVLAACEAPLNLEGVDRERQQSTYRFDQFQAVAASGERVVMVGSAGVVLSSSDKGQSWQRYSLEGAPSLIDVVACGDGHFVALAMGRKVWVSDPEAEEWSVIEIPTMEEVLAIECRADNSYWITGSFTTVISSTDGGANWTENSLGEDAQLTTIQFLNNEVGYAGGEFGIFLKTEDGGVTWNNIESVPGDFYPQDSFFRNENEGWVVGLSGGVFYTSDGGMSWQAQDSGTQIPLYGVGGDQDTLVAVGESGAVLRYQNGQWQRVSYDGAVLAYLRGVVVSGDTAVIVGGNGATVSAAL
jgi:photosystem II stability/assembly factor-like uncharacterized protein